MRLYRMVFFQARVRLVQAGAVFTVAALIAGCGNSYRNSVQTQSVTGPPPQPSSFAVAVSSPSPTTPGIATVIDYSGDSIMATAAIGPGPTAFSVDPLGANGYTINSDHTLTEFPVSYQLQELNVSYATLPTTAQPLNFFTPAAGLWAANLDGNLVDFFKFSPLQLVDTVPISPSTSVPVTVLGSPNYLSRYFSINQNLPSSPSGMECNASPYPTSVTGSVTAIETSNYAADPPITVGICPVFAVMGPYAERLFVLNRGSDTISVIYGQTDQLDNQCPTGCVNQSGQTYYSHPALPLSTAAVTATGITPPNGTSGMPATAGPVYAEYNFLTSQLVVANYDAGTVSIIDVSLDEYGNDSPTFGTTYTVPVGKNPASVTVLVDGSRAYTANQGDQSVTIVNLSSHTVEKTLAVTGHPRTVVSTQNSTSGKVYVSSPDSNELTIIRTDEDIVPTTLQLEGNIVDVRVTSQNAVNNGGNYNYVSRIPGWGQPCNLPDTASLASLAACQTLP
jgi:YVTN family beta-propeller protein